VALRQGWPSSYFPAVPLEHHLCSIGINQNRRATTDGKNSGFVEKKLRLPCSTFQAEKHGFLSLKLF
jgi:hypothetical protein